MKVTHSALPMTLGGLIMGFWIYYGYAIPTFFAEELEKPKVHLLIASISALILAYVIFLLATILLERAVPADWIAAEGFLANNPDAVKAASGGQSIVAMPWITFYAAIVKPVPALIFFVTFAWLFTLINLVQTYLYYVSRIIYSWSLDQVVPNFLKGSAERPLNRSVIMSAILALVGLVDAAEGGPLSTQLTFVFFVVVVQLVPVFSLTFLPKLSPETFARISPFWQRSFLGIPRSSAIGGVTLLYLLWMVAASFLFPAVGVADPLYTLSILVGFLLVGFLVYLFTRSRRLQQEGIDIDDIYKSFETELVGAKASTRWD